MTPPPKPISLMDFPVGGTGGAAGGGSGGGSGKSAADQIADTIAALKFEQEQLGRTAAEQEIYNQLKRAGTTLDTEAGQAIRSLVLDIEGQKEATKAAAEEQERMHDALKSLAASGWSAFESWARGADSLADSIANLAIELAFAEAKAAFLHALNPSSPLGPLATALGGGGLLSGIFGGGGAAAATGAPMVLSGALPGNFNGTDNWRGGLTWVGERGRELVDLPKGSRVVPDRPAAPAAGGMPNVRLVIDNASGVPLEAKETGRSMEGDTLVLKATLNQMAASGDLDAGLGSRFGLRPMTRRRSG